jgi:hypothetical protein
LLYLEVSYDWSKKRFRFLQQVTRRCNGVDGLRVEQGGGITDTGCIVGLSEGLMGKIDWIVRCYGQCTRWMVWEHLMLLEDSVLVVWCSKLGLVYGTSRAYLEGW